MIDKLSPKERPEALIDLTTLLIPFLFVYAVLLPNWRKPNSTFKVWLVTFVTSTTSVINELRVLEAISKVCPFTYISAW